MVKGRDAMPSATISDGMEVEQQQYQNVGTTKEKGSEQPQQCQGGAKLGSISLYKP